MTALLPKGLPKAFVANDVVVRIKWDAAGDLDGFVFGTDVNGKTVMFPACGHPLEALNNGMAPAVSGYFIAPNKDGKYPNDYECEKNPFAAWILPPIDARDGAAAGWDEETLIHLDKVPKEIVRLDAVIAINPFLEDGKTPNPLTFAQVEKVACELAGTDGKTIFGADVAFTNPEMWGLQAIWFCSIIRTSSGWSFQNVMFADAAKFGYYNDFQDMDRATIPTHNV